LATGSDQAVDERALAGGGLQEAKRLRQMHEQRRHGSRWRVVAIARDAVEGRSFAHGVHASLSWCESTRADFLMAGSLSVASVRCCRNVTLYRLAMRLPGRWHST